VAAHDLSGAHRGYAYQDLVTAYLLANALLKDLTVIVDVKTHPADLFDDISTKDQNHQVRRQFKTSLDTSRALQLRDLSTAQSNTRIDDLIRSFKADIEPATEYRLCATWRIDPQEALMQFLEPASAESSFHPHATKLYRIRHAQIWPSTGNPIWEPLTEAADISREDFALFCGRFIIEAECPTASLDLAAPGRLERLLFDKLAQEVGVGRYPNDGFGLPETAAMLVTLATKARARHETISPADIIKHLGLRTDYGCVSQEFPMDETILVHTDTLLSRLMASVRSHESVIATGEPGCGKSWALTQLAQKLSGDGSIVARHYCYLEPGDPDVQRRIRTNALFGNLISELAIQEPELTRELRPRFSAGPEELEQLLKHLHKLQPERRIYLIVDGLDHISRVFAESSSLSIDDIDIVERLALLSLPDNVCLIAGSQPGTHLDALRPTSDIFPVPGWSPDEILSLADKIGVIDALRTAGFADSLEEFKEELVKRAEGNPLYATLVSKQIKANLAAPIDPIATIREIPIHEGDLGRYYTYLLGGNGEFADVAEVLGVIDFAVAEDELAEILPQAAHRVASALLRISPILEQVAMQGGIRIYHESFRRFVIEKLRRAGATIGAILSPVIDWLYRKDFYSDAKAYRFLVSCLRRAGRHDEIYELCAPDFVSKSVAAGHSPDAIIQNILILVETGSRQQRWPLLARASELQRSVATLLQEGLDPERYARTFAAIRGAHALSGRLLFEGRPTYSREVGLILCSLCDDSGEVPPWKEYLQLTGRLDRNELPPGFDLAWFHGFIRARGSEAAFRLLSTCLSEWKQLPAYTRPLIQRLAKHGGQDQIEQLAKLPNIPPLARHLVLLELARLVANRGESDKASRIASDLLAENLPIGLKFECLQLGAPTSLLDLAAIDPASYDIATEGDKYHVDEPDIAGWVSCVGVLTRANDDRVDKEFRRLQGTGWYRCWLRYVIHLAKAEAVFAQDPSRATQLVLSGFKELGSDVAPFQGKPRACDLYSIHDLIQNSIKRGLELLPDLAAWNEVLPTLYNVSIRTTTYLQGASSGPLDAEALFQVLKPFSSKGELANPIVDVIERRLAHSKKIGGLYYDFAWQELLLSEILMAVGNPTAAEDHWSAATRFMCAYGQRKDITIFELLDSFHGLAGATMSERQEALTRLQPLVDAVVDHTDGRETRHAPVSWFEQLVTLDPASASIALSKSLLRHWGLYDWRLEESVDSFVERTALSANPLIVAHLSFTRTPAANSSAADAIERSFQIDPTRASELLRLFYAALIGDQISLDTGLMEKTRAIGLRFGVNLSTYVEKLERKESKKETTEQRAPTQPRGPSSVQIDFPSIHSLSGAMKAILTVNTEAIENPTQRDKVVNLVGYSLLELLDQEHHSHASILIKLFARRRWFMTDATHLAELAAGLQRHGYSDLAATAFTLAYTRSRGGGGWLSLGGSEHIDWFLQAFQLSQQTALATLAEEIARYLDGSSFVYGVTAHLIDLLGRVGMTEAAATSWWEAFSVIDHRLPRNEDEEGVFAQYQQSDLDWETDVSLILLLLARLSSPHQPTKLAGLAGFAQLCSAIPDKVAQALRLFLTLDLSPVTQLVILKCLIEFDLPPRPIAREIVENLQSLATSDKFGIAYASRILLHRANQTVPAGRTLVELKPGKLAPKKQKAVLSLDSRGRVGKIRALWPEFPSLLAAHFDCVWHSSDMHKRRWQSREELARSIANRSYPRAPITSWSQELFESVFHEVLNHIRPLSLDGGDFDWDIARLLVNELLPDVRTHSAYFYSRTIRPPLPLPADQFEGTQPISALPPNDEFSSWIRLAYYEEQLVLDNNRTFPSCTGTVTALGGAVSGEDHPLQAGSLPFGTGKVQMWWPISENFLAATTGQLVGPLVGLDFVASFLGVYTLLIPHPKYWSDSATSPILQPGPFVLQDENGNPCMRFRWWRVGPLGDGLDESAPILEGCDLLARPDFWQTILDLCKPPLTFEVKISRRKKTSPS